MGKYRGLRDESDIMCVYIGFRVPVEERKVLVSLARERDLSMSSLLRSIISDYIRELKLEK